MKYREILEAAIAAPSGDNCQPWQFEVVENEIRLFNLPERDTSLFNYMQRASLIAHGALLENLAIAASAHGFAPYIHPFPDQSNPQHIATVRLAQAEPIDEPLYPWIKQRCTTRKMYDRQPLSPEKRTALMATAESCGIGTLHLLEEGEKRTAAEVIGLNDRVVFENPHLHRFLFDHLRWSDEEAARTRDGLDIRTLELAPLDAVAFRMFRNWKLLHFANMFGVSGIIAGNARKLARSASAIGIVTLPGNSEEDFLAGGRLLERVWLEATRQGLSFQLMTGITFLMNRVRDGATDLLAPEHVRLIRAAYDRLLNMCGGVEGDTTIAVMFRVGSAPVPSAMSLRLPVEHFCR